MNHILHFESLLKKIFGIVLTMAILLISSHARAQEESQIDQPSGTAQELSPGAPDLADFVPLAAELTGHLATLKNEVSGLPDVSEVQEQYDVIEANLKDPAAKVESLKGSKDYSYNRLLELRAEIKQEGELFEKASEPITQAIRHLGDRREEWQAEKEQWNEWQSSLLKEGEPEQLTSTFKTANETIDTALNLILPQLEGMLTAQEKAGHTKAKINALSAELDGLIEEERRNALLNESPPMFSSQYFSQFKAGELWAAVQKSLDDISWPGKRFFDQQGWIVLIQGFITLFVIIAVYRNRRKLNESECWRFLTARPLASGFFLGVMTTVWIYEYEGAPAIWKLIYTIIGGISFTRISGSLIEASWKRQFVYGLMFVFIVTRIMDVVGFPPPLFRLFTASTALVGFPLCLWWAGESTRHKDPVLYGWLLRLGALFLVIIIIAELWGKRVLASYLFASSIHSIATVLVFMLFTYMIRGGLEWLFNTSPLRRVAVLHTDTDAVIRQTAHIIDVAVWGMVLLPAVLMIWGVFDTLEQATKGLLALGFNVGSQRITVGLLIASIIILYGSFLASWILQKLLMDEVLLKRRLERGVRHALARLTHYIIIFVGFMIVISTLGFEITKLTIMISALGVGIGFGLQSVVNNFVSGLILLFERPIRVGDYVEINGQWSEIKRIGLRATTVQTFDQADVIIPNADLVTNQVTNWTLSNRQVRARIPVGVAYGSDVPLVMETLAACAKGQEMLAAYPSPQVLFLSFGASSLDFELRVWVKDADHRLKVKSELHQEIDRRFREANIEIAFPQQDLHLRSVDESAIMRFSEKTP